METKAKPATSLPWKMADANDPDGRAPNHDCPVIRAKKGNSAVAYLSINRLIGEKAPSKAETANGAYIVHAANAYPQLVAALRDVLSDRVSMGSLCTQDLVRADKLDAASALLRSLGEA